MLYWVCAEGRESFVSRQWDQAAHREGRRQGLGDAYFRELTFVGPSFSLHHLRDPQPFEELPIPLSSLGGKVQADNRAPAATTGGTLKPEVFHR